MHQPKPNMQDTDRADRQEEFDEHALVEGYFERDEDEPSDEDFGDDEDSDLDDDR